MKQGINRHGYHALIPEREMAEKVFKAMRKPTSLQRKWEPRRKGKPYDPAAKHKEPT